MSAAIFLPGQSLTRTLQLNYSLDPGASGSVHLYSSVFGVTASVILFRKVKVSLNLIFTFDEIRALACANVSKEYR